MENNYCNGCPGGDESGKATFMGPLGKVKGKIMYASAKSISKVLGTGGSTEVEDILSNSLNEPKIGDEDMFELVEAKYYGSYDKGEVKIEIKFRDRSFSIEEDGFNIGYSFGLSIDGDRIEWKNIYPNVEYYNGDGKLECIDLIPIMYTYVGNIQYDESAARYMERIHGHLDGRVNVLSDFLTREGREKIRGLQKEGWPVKLNFDLLMYSYVVNGRFSEIGKKLTIEELITAKLFDYPFNQLRSFISGKFYNGYDGRQINIFDALRRCNSLDMIQMVYDENHSEVERYSRIIPEYIRLTRVYYDRVRSAYEEIERFKDSTLKKYSLDKYSVEVIEPCSEMEPLAPLVFLEREINKEK